MKINKIIKNIRWVVLMSIAGIVIVTSCNYDEKNLIDGKGTGIVRMQIAPNPNSYGINFGLAAFDAVVETRGILTINRDAVSNADLNKPVTVNYSLDSSYYEILNDSLNANGLDTFNIVPPSAYVFTTEGLSGNSLTFAAGEAVKEIAIKIDPSTLDLSKQFLIPFSISNASGSNKVSVDTWYALVQIIIKNQYDGTYHSIGYFGHPSVPRDIDKDKVLATRGAAAVSMELGDLAPTGMIINVNPDNSITLVSADNPAAVFFTAADEATVSYPGNIVLHPWSYYDNRYHTDTKSFRLRYGYHSASGWRTVTEEVTAK